MTIASAAPLKPAEDALRLDNSTLGIDATVDVLLGWWQQRNPLDRLHGNADAG